MNPAIARVLTLGSLGGLALCAAATLARALGLGADAWLARAGVMVLFATPPVLLAVTGLALHRQRARKHALAAAAALAALLFAAARAAFGGR